MRLVYIVCLFVLLSFSTAMQAHADIGDSIVGNDGTLDSNDSYLDEDAAPPIVESEEAEYQAPSLVEQYKYGNGQQYAPKADQEEEAPSLAEQYQMYGEGKTHLPQQPQREVEYSEQQSRGDHHPPTIEQREPAEEPVAIVSDKAQKALSKNQKDAYNQYYKSRVTGEKLHAEKTNWAELNKAYDSCLEEKPNAEQCCGGNLAESECIDESMQVIITGTNQIVSTMQQAAQLSSQAAVCKAHSKAYQISTGMLTYATAICAKSAYSCQSECDPSKFIDQCENLVSEDNVVDCERKAKTMKANRTSCRVIQGLNAANAYMVNSANEIQKKLNKCNASLLDEDIKCELDENKELDACNPITLCAQAGSENLPICQSQSTDTGVANTIPGLDIPSNGGGGPTDGNGSATPFGPEGEEQGFDPLAQAISNDSGGSDQQASGSGGGAPSGSGGGGSGGDSGGKAGKAGSGKSRNILKGTSSGNGYVSRSSGGSGGGGYRAKSYSRSSGSRDSKGFPKFNLKSFLPKSKEITKGRLKGYNRLPSGNLMVPQNLDIFDVHHRSYQNACKRGHIIKGCGPAASKKLGAVPSVRDLNSRYRAQLALQKESVKQRQSRSGIRVRSLKNNISTQASTTYYQIKYLNKNKIRKLPAKDPLAALGKKDTSKYKDWHKMQSWINSKTKAVSTPSSNRIPASVK